MTPVAPSWIPPPPPLGSGKLGTPCERMQLANASALDEVPDAFVALDLCEEPHAASTSVQPSARLARTKGFGITRQVYCRRHNRAVTRLCAGYTRATRPTA